MKKAILILALATTGSVFAQKKTTTSATVKFDATTKLDALPVAENKTVVALIDTKGGTVAFEAQIKGFQFGNPMMQEHFNGPKWMDSEKNPTSTFKGKITNVADVKFDQDGTYVVNIEGDLTMHGISKPLTGKATIVVKAGAVSATSDFTIKLADYSLGNAGGKLADEPKITVSADFK
ncbi:MAG: YceI family protein [Chitinophagaceae bacterium]|nr:YceI family protein [Chitinophagaceae bacterium]